LSTNGHVVTPKAVEIAASNRLRQTQTKSDKVRLNGNVARRKVRADEFFWWDIELPGFGLRAFAAGSRSWFVQFRQRGKQKRVTLGRPPKLLAEEAGALARAQLAKVALDGLPKRPIGVRMPSQIKTSCTGAPPWVRQAGKGPRQVRLGRSGRWMQRAGVRQNYILLRCVAIGCGHGLFGSAVLSVRWPDRTVGIRLSRST
jgi:Arm DNA-binding domain